jgi:peptide/nickel transport system permease protein
MAARGYPGPHSLYHAKGESPVRQYILRRVLQMIPILIGVSILMFAIIKATPGDPFAYLLGPRVKKEQIEKMKDAAGLNKPLPVQYVNWVKQTVTGNFGYSLRNGQSIAKQLKNNIPNTLILTMTAFVIGVGLAIPIGVISATRPYSLVDYAATTFAFMGISLPSFFTALIAIYFFAFTLKWVPANQMTTPGQPFHFWDLVHHLILPATVLGLREIATWSRYTRGSMMETLRQDYIRTARSKGVAERLVIYKHAFRNSLIPIVTLLGFSLPDLFGGAVIFETLFTWPGMGQMTFEAVNNRDFPVLMVTNMFFAILVIIGSLMADILYVVVDPRIRYS